MGSAAAHLPPARAACTCHLPPAAHLPKQNSSDKGKRERKARQSRRPSEVKFWRIWHQKVPFVPGLNAPSSRHVQRSPRATPRRQPRRVLASTASGSKHSGRGPRSGAHAGLSVHGRERPETQVSVGERTPEIRDLGFYLPNCNKGPQCNGGSRSAVTVNVRSGSADALPRLRHFSQVFHEKDRSILKSARVGYK